MSPNVMEVHRASLETRENSHWPPDSVRASSTLTQVMSSVNRLVWITILLFAGAFGEEDVCRSSPCQNSGMCVSQGRRHKCHCSPEPQNGVLYGGQNCTVPLLGCEDHRCQNGATCTPYLSNGRHRSRCSCPPGFTGTRCQTSTTLSFEKSGFLRVLTTQEQNSLVSLNVTLSFRTVQRNATLLRWLLDDQLLTIELRDGGLCCTLRCAGNEGSVLLELHQAMADGHWHTTRVSLSDGILRLSLLDPYCVTSESCHKEVQVEATDALPDQGSGLAELGIIAQSIYIGGTGSEQAQTSSFFLGCFRDIRIRSRTIVPSLRAVTPDQEQVNMSLGCSEMDGCEDAPCQNKGRCISLGWRNHTCECHRPYEGENCSEEYIVARFGNEDLESYAVFTVEDEPGESLTISMFVRTRQQQGLLLILSNSTSQYLRLWLEGGKVKVQINNFESLLGQDSVSDGHFHLVSITVEPGTLTLSQSAINQGSVAIRNILVQVGDVVHVGGLLDRRAALAFGGYFKGCIQDLRIGSRRLQFYPISPPVSSFVLEAMVEVIPGCTGDQSCSKHPCLNGGMCYSMWDDFACSCPPNTAGRQCEEVKWCELSPCPSTAVCQIRDQGFECVTNVTLRENNPVITYRGNGKIHRPLHSISLRFRTRALNGTLLHAERGSEFLTVSLQNGHLALALQVREEPSLLQLQSVAVVSDGLWHSAILSMDRPALPVSTWTIIVDQRREEASISSESSGRLDFLKEGVDIMLGGLKEVSGTMANFEGCLGLVEIEGLLLPFYSQIELNLPRPQEEQFVRTSGDPNFGCWGSNMCEPNPCQHGGKCQDIFYLFECHCPSDWGGRTCETGPDPCTPNPCIHGICSTVSTGYECLCEAGYTGQHCDEVVDMCIGHKCSNGGICLRGHKRYACLCPRNTMGPLCKERIPELPWYIDRIPYPKLPVSVCGNERWNYTCFNGGNCSDLEDMCNCLPGFTGQWCEQELDECASEPCLNGGFCRNLINKFQCVCEMSFAGEQCQIDVSDFYLYVFLLLWQNIFQLLSYLILRLDDDPEIEWNAANDE